ncbi:MAG: septal ring lytic transglycosylase RlpA family protein [bacterium]|nr:septal ring lytic transglycosylase RlpA family protein [bacterium]
MISFKVVFTPLILILLLASGCAPRKTSREYVQIGYASYYGKEFRGRKTASGEKYDPKKLTAAHPTLPFNTYVKVTNLENGKSVIVRINDRGPFKKGRIIDLSEKAAELLDMKIKGVVLIKLEVVAWP